MSGHIFSEAPQGCRLAILSLLETLVGNWLNYGFGSAKDPIL